ncbi:unnamed protein product [Heligmosomoides polygyrus]|uniref:CBM21 domain-containing protein n=1 Tax=Heligmosomoides polygyrus TaxID=6339 RepID=A0A183FTS0_HELPZ|nr:unnamed protein product [Heligmosomoides polygyrus]
MNDDDVCIAREEEHPLAAIKKFCFMDLEEVVCFEEFKILQTEATQLMADINVAKSLSLERRLILCAADPVTLPPSGITFSVSNCTKSWILSADGPFVNIDLVAAAITWTPEPRENIYVLSMSLYRFLLKMDGKEWWNDKVERKQTGGVSIPLRNQIGKLAKERGPTRRKCSPTSEINKKSAF